MNCMTIPTLDLSLPPTERWPDILTRNPSLEADWRALLSEFEAGAQDVVDATIRTFYGRGAVWLHNTLNSTTRVFTEELKGVAHYLGVDRDLLLAGQLIYDASTTGEIDATCGCTSASQLWEGRPWHGRLMDWNWPSGIRDRVRLIRVKGGGRGSYMAEHIPGATGFVGAYTNRLAANLNQAPFSSLRWTATPALWWFRHAFESRSFDRPGYAPGGGMTDALIHVTHSNADTSRFYYMDGVPHARRDKLSDAPVVLANTFDMEGVAENAEAYDWSLWREGAIRDSRKRLPMKRLREAFCDDTVHSWSVTL